MAVFMVGSQLGRMEATARSAVCWAEGWRPHQYVQGPRLRQEGKERKSLLLWGPGSLGQAYLGPFSARTSELSSQ